MTISHQPVSELNWPAMVMGFELSPQINLQGFSVDDVVSFEFEQAETGMYQIISIEQDRQP